MLIAAAGQSAAAQNTAAIKEQSLPKLMLAKVVDAVNSGNEPTIAAFVENEIAFPPRDAGGPAAMSSRLFNLHHDHGGFTIERITKAEPNLVRGLAQAKSGDGWIEFIVATKPGAKASGEVVEKQTIVGIGFGDVLAPPELLPKERLSDEQLRSKIDSMVAALVHRDAFSGVVYVARAGRPIYFEAFGKQSGHGDSRNAKATRFHLASITKMFTAISIAQLVEAGQIRYEDTIDRILKDYPNREVAKSVTVHQLLSHSSGLVGAQQSVVKKLQPISSKTVLETFGSAPEQPLFAPPGRRFEYSNFGYSVLGRMIEAASGESYHNYIRRHVFEPAKMSQTDFVDLDSSPTNIAEGFMDAPDDQRVNNRSQLSVIGTPYGGAYSTAEDLDRFRVALLENKLVAQETRDRMWQGVMEPQKNVEYGYGTEITHYNGVKFIYHGGGWPGVTNRFEFSPDLQSTVIILSNYDINTQLMTNRCRQWLTQSPDNLPPDEGPPKFEIKFIAPSGPIAVGEVAKLGLEISNRGKLTHACVVDFEIKNAKGIKIHQQFVEQQRFANSQTRRYDFLWIPDRSGEFMLEAGLFGGGWQPKFDFVKSHDRLVVQ